MFNSKSFIEPILEICKEFPTIEISFRFDKVNRMLFVSGKQLRNADTNPLVIQNQFVICEREILLRRENGHLEHRICAMLDLIEKAPN